MCIVQYCRCVFIATSDALPKSCTLLFRCCFLFLFFINSSAGNIIICNIVIVYRSVVVRLKFQFFSMPPYSIYLPLCTMCIISVVVQVPIYCWRIIIIRNIMLENYVITLYLVSTAAFIQKNVQMVKIRYSCNLYVLEIIYYTQLKKNNNVILVYITLLHHILNWLWQ